MKTPEEILIEEFPHWSGYITPGEIVKVLNAAGYVIRSRQANFNAARMEAALIGIAAGEGWPAEEAKAALKWCEEHPA